MRAGLMALAAAVGLTAVAVQSQGGRPGAPQLGALDTKTLLFNAANALGMLRGLQQEDSITTFEFWATGSIRQNGQLVQLSSYRASVRFRDVPGMRVDYVREGRGQAANRQIHVVAGTFAWNETEPGRGAEPAMDAVAERLTQLWSLPQAVVKAATLAGEKTTVGSAGGATTLTYPIPGLATATATATLNQRYLVERVVTRFRDTVLETTYDDYGDWNDRDYKADVLFPRRLTQKRDGVTVLDLTTSRTNTYNPYVIMPVPEAVSKLAGGSPGG
jgi:hypothetical protein